MAKELNSGKAITKEQVKSVKKLSISSTSEITSLKDVIKLESIKELTINNENITSLKGLGGAKNTLTKLWLYGNNIESFEGIEECTNLQELYLQNFSDEQFRKICEAMSNTNYTKLTKFAAIGYWHDHWTPSFTDERYTKAYFNDKGTYVNGNVKLTNISPLSKLTKTTRDSITYMLLSNNYISSVSVLSNFPNIKQLKVESNNIASLDGIIGNKKLEDLRMADNNLSATSLDALATVNSKTGSLESTLPKLKYLDVRENKKIENVKNVAVCKTLTKLWFTSDLSLARNDSDNKLNVVQIKQSDVKTFLISLGSGLKIDGKYSFMLLDPNTRILELKKDKDDTTTTDYTLDVDEFKGIATCEYITHLSIDGLKLTENGTVITDTNKLNRIYEETLSNLTRVRYLQILNISNLSSINFIENMEHLIELDVRKCSKITDFTCLNNLNVSKLAINNTKVDLKTIQPAINRMGRTPYKVNDNGKFVDSKDNELSYTLNSAGQLVDSNGTTYTMNAYDKWVDPNGKEFANTSKFVSMSLNYWSLGRGLVLCDDNLYKKLEDCVNLERLYMYRSWESNGKIAADGLDNTTKNAVIVNLTRLTSLKYFYGYAIYADFTLPANVEVVKYGYVTDQRGRLRLNNCSKMTHLYTPSWNHKTVLDTMLDSIPTPVLNPETGTYTGLTYLSLTNQSQLQNFSKLAAKFKNSNLKTIDLQSSVAHLYISSLEGLNQISSLEKIYIAYADNLTVLPDMSKLTNLNTLKITNTGLTEIGANVNLQKLPLVSLDLGNNSIANIEGLMPEAEDDFQYLEALSLSNNCLYNTTSSEEYSIVEEIFIPLHDRRLRRLYLENNPNFTDTEKLKALSWNNKSGF